MFDCIDYTPVAQFAINSDHVITYWNRACELMTGFKAQEMVGTERQWEPFYNEKRPALADLIVDQDQNQLTEWYSTKGIRRSRVISQAWEAFDFFENLGGAPHYLYFLAVPIQDEQGNIVGALETLQDISAHQILYKNSNEQYRALYEGSENPSLLAKGRFQMGGLIGKSHAMQDVYEKILKAAATEANIVIYGESGTGKELAARAIHKLSRRSDKKFVPINCGAIPENLFESEFFGYRKGAFTGAENNKSGYLDQANGGTLFLDEVGDLTPTAQLKLLRVLDTGEYMPVGSNRMVQADIRILAATNKNFIELVKSGDVREDFFYRIHIIPIEIPPLRDRKEDIRLLVDYFFEKFNAPSNFALPEKVRTMLASYAWPGNVRELQNVLQRYIALEQLDFTGPSSTAGDNFTDTLGKPGKLVKALEKFECYYIQKTLEDCCWKRHTTANVLGVSRKTLFRKMKKHGLL